MTHTIVSIQAGGIQTTQDAFGNPWTSGYRKAPVATPVLLKIQGLPGDDQYDKESHGGIDKALLAYSFDYYPEWKTELGLSDLPAGSFAENLTLSGINENEVCIGDIYQIGDEIILEVSQPRLPCKNINRFFGRNDMVKQVAEKGATGWYLRVIQGGLLSAEMPIKHLKRPYPQWTITRAHFLMRHAQEYPTEALEFAHCPALESSWQQDLKSKVQ
ncbi:MOSC domain-containing protein [Anaerolineales bacterium]